MGARQLHGVSSLHLWCARVTFRWYQLELCCRGFGEEVKNTGYPHSQRGKKWKVLHKHHCVSVRHRGLQHQRRSRSRRRTASAEKREWKRSLSRFAIWLLFILETGGFSVPLCIYCFEKTPHSNGQQKDCLDFHCYPFLPPLPVSLCREDFIQDEHVIYEDLKPLTTL